jgi:hypothetical protein
MPNDFSKFLNMQNKEVVGRRPNEQPANSSADTAQESVPKSYEDLWKLQWQTYRPGLFLDQEANAGPYFRGQQQKRAKPHLQLLQHLSSLVTRQGICKIQSRSQKVAVQNSISGPKHRMKICYPPSLRSNKIRPTPTHNPHLLLRTLFCACRQMTLAQKLAPSPYFSMRLVRCW